jgi:hypothetical protein
MIFTVLSDLRDLAFKHSNGSKCGVTPMLGAESRKRKRGVYPPTTMRVSFRVAQQAQLQLSLSPNQALHLTDSAEG